MVEQVRGALPGIPKKPDPGAKFDKIDADGDGKAEVRETLFTGFGVGELWTRISNPQGGFVLWIELPRGTDALELLQRAMAENISLTPGMMFSATRKYRNFIRINCGFPWNGEIEQAIARRVPMITHQRRDLLR